MKQLCSMLLFCSVVFGYSKNKGDSGLRSLLIEQLQSTQTDEDWFVPTKLAVTGLSYERSIWKDSTGNHSIAELVSHLTYWNEVYLKVLEGEGFSDLDIDNENTFAIYLDREWENLVTKLDSVQTELERMTEKASEKQLIERAPDIFDLTAHNAYHTGQIIYIRKQNGWWPSNKK